MKQSKIEPIFRMQGSKYRQIDFIIEKLKICSTDCFIDVFGGTGIVGLNVYKLTGADVFINDYDDILHGSLKDLFLEAFQSQISFSGYGKHITESALNYFKKKLDNNWFHKVKIYYDYLQDVEIKHWDYRWWNNIEDKKIYLDPPYFNKEAKGIYKGNVKIQEFIVFANSLALKNTVLISIDDSEEIRNYFKDWTLFEKDMTYTETQKGKSKKVKELWFLKGDK